MENDANACAYAECFFGEGRMCKDFLYLTVSNSIGGALCLNGEIYTGAWGEAGEFGMCPAEDLLERTLPYAARWSCWPPGGDCRIIITA